MNRHKGSKRSQSSSRARKRFTGTRPSEMRSDDQADRSSASAKKLCSARADDVTVNLFHAYRVIDFFWVFATLAQILVCAICKGKVTFGQSGQRGLGFKIVVSCMCGEREVQSGPMLGTGYEINRRVVFVMRILDVAHEGLNIFCNLMDISVGLSQSACDKIVRHVHTAATTLFEKFTKKAAEEEKAKNIENGRPENDFKVSGDGS